MNWTVKRVKDVASLAIGPFGSALKTDSYVAEGVPIVAGGNLGSGRWPEVNYSPCVSNETADRLRRSVAVPGDVIFPHRGSIGRVGIADREMMLSTSMMKARFNSGEVDPEFAYWFFQARGSRELLTMASSVGTPGIGQPLASLGSVWIEFPSLGQQKILAGVLGALDDKIAANNRAIDLGRELLRATWDSVVDENTRNLRLKEVATVNPRVAKSKHAEPAYVDMKALPEYGLLISEAGHREAKGGARFMRSDTLMARITPCFENGKMAYVDFLDAGEIGYGSTEFIVFRSLEGVPSAVPYVVVASTDFREFAARSMIGTSGRQRVQAKGLEDFELRWPDDQNLAEFGEFSDALLRRLGAARDENLRLAATRDELLPLLMSGKITVKDAEKTVEEVV